MAELTLEEIRAALKRLETLEQEIRQIREILCAQIPPAPNAQQTDHPYIEKVPTILSGEPIIRGTRTPVRAIVEHWRFGQTPEEIIQSLPYLRLAQVCDALGYYDDHPKEIDHYIAINQVPVQ
jgi:uncharacterized protein (DUF433 family)